METGVEPPPQDVLDAVAAAKRAVAQIKQESGEIDSSFSDAKRYPYPPNLARNAGENTDIFAAYSVPSGIDKGLGHEPLNLPVHFQQQQPLADEEGAAVPLNEESQAAFSYQQPQAASSDGHEGQGQGAALSAGGGQVDSEVGPVGAVSVCAQNVTCARESPTPPPAVVQEFERSAPRVKRASKASADRVEKTTRRLRVRQSTAVQHSVCKEQSAALDKQVLDHRPSSSRAEEAEMLPPPAKELRPRRLTRKPRHTQRVWRLDIVGEAFDRWRGIGHNQGLSSDTEIAVFLMQHYENALSGQPTGSFCVNCNSVLTLTCVVCHTPTQFVDTPKPSLNSQSQSSAAATGAQDDEGEAEAKVEPQEVPTDGELEPEPEPFEVEPDDKGEEEEQEEEEEEEEAVKKKKAKPGKRKRGRPVGSGRRQVTGSTAGKTRLKIRKYKCTYAGCDAAFAKSSRLKIHTRIHTGEKPYVCKECNRAFTQKSGLTVHMQKHSGLRPFPCEECGATFPSSSTLKQHMRRHTGEKPFQCKKCDKTFRWSGHLTQHMRMHDGIKPFLCQECGKSFSASSDLVKHKVTHTKDRPYQCNLCDKAYSFQHRLTAHKRSHTGDRPFLCCWCGSAFARAHNLTVHIRTHTGDKPYRCNECGVRFADSGNFSKHKKTKHGDTAKNVCNSKTSDLANVSDASSNSDLTGASDVTRLPDFSHLPDMTKMSEYARMNTGKLPSMAKVASAAKMAAEVNFMTAAGDQDHRVNSAVATASHSLAATATSAASSQQRASPPSDIADFKSLLPPMGMEPQLSAVPHHLSTPLQVGSPPALPVQNRMSVSPAMSPAVSVPPQSSPGPSRSSDSRISPMPQPAHQIQDYRVPQHDGVVFPPTYYNNYPYYYQQQ